MALHVLWGVMELRLWQTLVMGWVRPLRRRARTEHEAKEKSFSSETKKTCARAPHTFGTTPAAHKPHLFPTGRPALFLASRSYT
jgi:hypothetical protein